MNKKLRDERDEAELRRVGLLFNSEFDTCYNSYGYY